MSMEKDVGAHRGGYDPFTLDIITRWLETDSMNELVVRVWDSTGANGEPHGKQHFNAIRTRRHHVHALLGHLADRMVGAGAGSSYRVVETRAGCR